MLEKIIKNDGEKAISMVVLLSNMSNNQFKKGGLDLYLAVSGERYYDIQELYDTHGVLLDVEYRFASRNKTLDGTTALHNTAYRGRSRFIRCLVETCCADVNARSGNTGFTALHFAAMNGHTNCVETLLELGADPTITDNYDHTALQVAEAWKRESIITLLAPPQFKSANKR